MIDVNWILPGEQPDSWVFPNLGKWIGSSAKTRLYNAERQRKHRKKRDKCHEKDVTKALPEKRREEYIEDTTYLPPISPKGDLANGIPPRKKRKRKPAIPYPPEILDWYHLYPKHRQNGIADPASAYPPAIDRILLNHPEMHDDYAIARGWLRQKTIEFAASPAGNDGEKTPLPATWLNGDRFEATAESWQVTYSQKQLISEKPDSRTLEQRTADLKRSLGR